MFTPWHRVEVPNYSLRPVISSQMKKGISTRFKILNQKIFLVNKSHVKIDDFAIHNLILEDEPKFGTLTLYI
jgi:hypothetical protein